jgi:hypothetical protein
MLLSLGGVSSQIYSVVTLPRANNHPPPDADQIGGWVAPRIGLDIVEEKNLLSHAGNLTLFINISEKYLLKIQQENFTILFLATVIIYKPFIDPLLYIMTLDGHFNI